MKMFGCLMEDGGHQRWDMLLASVMALQQLWRG